MLSGDFVLDENDYYAKRELNVVELFPFQGVNRIKKNIWEENFDYSNEVRRKEGVRLVHVHSNFFVVKF